MYLFLKKKKTKQAGDGDVLVVCLLVCSPALRARCLPGSGSRSLCPFSTGRCPAPGSLGLEGQPGKEDIQHVELILSRQQTPKQLHPARSFSLHLLTLSLLGCLTAPKGGSFTIKHCMLTRKAILILILRRTAFMVPLSVPACLN